jgi:pimeloyl-ACP methyl ester carboxylesterase
MAKVEPESGGGPKFKKPIQRPGAGSPMTEYDPRYLERKATFLEKRFDCKSGRHFSYITEGNPEDPAVLMLHGIGESKWCWVFPEPLDGIFLIVPDRQGHGLSSPCEGPPDLTQLVPEYIELLDDLKVDKFYAAGHSFGAMSAVQIAAAFPDRVLGCAPIAGPVLFNDKHATPEERTKFDSAPCGMIAALSKSSCWGSFSRCVCFKVMGAQAHPDTTKDFGFAAKYAQYRGIHVGGTERSWSTMDKDTFFITKMMDSNLHGANRKNQFVWELMRAASPEGSPYDLEAVKCPTFIYQGRKEAVNPGAAAEVYHRVIKGSKLIWFDDHGHVTVCMEAEKIIRALVKLEAAETPVYA